MCVLVASCSQSFSVYRLLESVSSGRLMLARGAMQKEWLKFVLSSEKLKEVYSHFDSTLADLFSSQCNSVELPETTVMPYINVIPLGCYKETSLAALVLYPSFCASVYLSFCQNIRFHLFTCPFAKLIPHPFCFFLYLSTCTHSFYFAPNTLFLYQPSCSLAYSSFLHLSSSHSDIREACSSWALFGSFSFTMA